MALALNKGTNGFFDIEFKDGKIVLEDNDLSFAKHNLLCFGRAYKELIPASYKRNGYIGSYLEKRQLYSLCWIGYIDGIINDTTIDFIKKSFNFSCDRDFNNGLTSKTIKIVDIIKTGNNELSITINISGEDLVLNF
jgi:hypothetical protein